MLRYSRQLLGTIGPIWVNYLLLVLNSDGCITLWQHRVLYLMTQQQVGACTSNNVVCMRLNHTEARKSMDPFKDTWIGQKRLHTNKRRT